MKRLLSIILCTFMLTACGPDEQTYPAEMIAPENTAGFSVRFIMKIHKLFRGDIEKRNKEISKHGNIS